MEAAHKVSWNGHNIMVSLTKVRFNECKSLLHDHHVRFSLLYPAVVIIQTLEGHREFDPKKALAYIHSLG